MATQADIDAIEKALASGERRVRFSDGREVEYRSVADLRGALGVLSSRMETVPMMRTTVTSFRRD